MDPDDETTSDAGDVPAAVPSGTPLAGRWASLHLDDQEFALMALDVLTSGDVESYGTWVRFVDAALDLQPAVDERIIDQALVRRIALAIVLAPDRDEEVDEDGPNASEPERAPG